MVEAADFRRIALSFDGTGEYPHFDRRAFKARVMFATLAADELTANIKFAPDEQALKCAAAPDAFAPLENAWGRQGWTCAILAALSEAELRAAIEMAWRRASAKPPRRGAAAIRGARKRG
jgi:YjbR